MFLLHTNAVIHRSEAASLQGSLNRALCAHQIQTVHRVCLRLWGREMCQPLWSPREWRDAVCNQPSGDKLSMLPSLARGTAVSLDVFIREEFQRLLSFQGQQSLHHHVAQKRWHISLTSPFRTVTVSTPLCPQTPLLANSFMMYFVGALRSHHIEPIVCPTLILSPTCTCPSSPASILW